MALAGQWRHGSIVEEVAVEGVSDQLGPGRALKLLLDVSSVRFNRADRDVKLRADLSVRVPEGEQPRTPTSRCVRSSGGPFGMVESVASAAPRRGARYVSPAATRRTASISSASAESLRT